MSFHGARCHGNQTSAAGLQQSQERQAPFLSISQEPNRRGVQREVGTIRLSEPGWRWGQGGVEVVFLLNGSAINHRNVTPYFTPPCLCSPFLPVDCPPPTSVSRSAPRSHPCLTFYLLTLQAESAPPTSGHPESFFLIHSQYVWLPQELGEGGWWLRAQALESERPEFKSQPCP